jgi:hypothetical protein
MTNEEIENEITRTAFAVQYEQADVHSSIKYIAWLLFQYKFEEVK